MFGRIKAFFDRAVVNTLIDQAEADNALTADTDPFTLDFKDRRRLAVSAILLEAERNEGFVYPGKIGQIILSNVTDEDEVIEMSDATNRSLAQIMRGRGMQ